MNAEGEEQLRAAYEEELSRISATDMIAQATVSLLNIGAQRLAGDLEQVRDAIDAVRALLEILERRIPQEVRPLREALSRLQMSYAREIAQGGAGAQAGAKASAQGAERQSDDGQPAAGGQPAADGQPAPGGQDEQPQGPGPAEASGRLWVPGR